MASHLRFLFLEFHPRRRRRLTLFPTPLHPRFFRFSSSRRLGYTPREEYYLHPVHDGGASVSSRRLSQFYRDLEMQRFWEDSERRLSSHFASFSARLTIILIAQNSFRISRFLSNTLSYSSGDIIRKFTSARSKKPLFTSTFYAPKCFCNSLLFQNRKNYKNFLSEIIYL